jgi:hypothetical protein
MDSPYGISAKRPLKAPKRHQEIFLPYGSVAMILEQQEEGQTPFGFSPSKA